MDTGSSNENILNLNFLRKFFNNKYEIAILTSWVYLLGVVFQVLKLIWGFTTTPKIGNLMFFSFSNSLNDFCIIFWVSLIFFMLSFTTVGIINFFIKELNTSGSRFIGVLLLLLTFVVVLFVGDRSGWELWDIKKAIFILFPFTLSTIILWYLLFNSILTKRAFYIFLSGFLLYGFFQLLYYSDSYYGCDQLRCNDANKNCILLEYKNDKYGFTWDWDVYKLDAFTSFYTVNYFKDEIKTWTETCEEN